MTTTVSSVVNHFPEAENGFTTTLASTISSGATTVPLNSVAGYTNGSVAVFVVDPSDVTKKQTFTGIIDTSGVQVTNVVWTAGTNQTHSGGATVVDYATATHISMITKGLLSLGANQDGTISPVVKTSIKDVNGNEVIKTPATASAVNDITVTNAATTVAPRVSATGDDTNIDLLISAKGTGSARFAGPNDGWVACDETLTYASASTFTCSAALAAVLSVGDRLKFTQTTVKYFVITGISGTTVTVLVNTDYTIANAAITLPFYSKQATPTGYPTYFNHTPTMVNVTVGNGTPIGTVSMVGKTVHQRGRITMGTTSDVTGSVGVTLVMATKADYGSFQTLGGNASFYDNGSQIYPGFLSWSTSTVVDLYFFSSTGATNPVARGIWTTTLPFDTANGDVLSYDITYEMA